MAHIVPHAEHQFSDPWRRTNPVNEFLSQIPVVVTKAVGPFDDHMFHGCSYHFSQTCPYGPVT